MFVQKMFIQEMIVPDYFRQYMRTLTNINYNIDDVVHYWNPELYDQIDYEKYKIMINNLIISGNPVSFFNNAFDYDKSKPELTGGGLLAINTIYGIILKRYFRTNCLNCMQNSMSQNNCYVYCLPNGKKWYQVGYDIWLCPDHMKHVVTFAENKIYEMYIILFNKYKLFKHFPLDIDSINYILKILSISDG